MGCCLGTDRKEAAADFPPPCDEAADRADFPPPCDEADFPPPCDEADHEAAVGPHARFFLPCSLLLLLLGLMLARSWQLANSALEPANTVKTKRAIQFFDLSPASFKRGVNWILSCRRYDL